MIFFDIAIPVLSTLCLLSFLLYVYYFLSGHWSIYELNNPSKFSIPRIIISVLAIIGFGLCLYSGINLMLFWLPEDWGYIKTEDGETIFITYQDSISALSSFVVCLIMCTTLIRLAEDQRKGLYYSVVAAGYEEILMAKSEKNSLELFKLAYEEIIKKLEKTVDVNGMPREYWEFLAYKHLVGDIENIIADRPISKNKDSYEQRKTLRVSLEKLSRDEEIPPDKRAEAKRLADNL